MSEGDKYKEKDKKEGKEGKECRWVTILDDSTRETSLRK